MNITVVGTGYVGLVTGVCFAHVGHNVICVDVDESKVSLLQEGKLPIYEPGLEDIFAKAQSAGNLQCTSSLEAGMEDADVVFLCLPTPPKQDGSADVSYVLNVASDIGKLIQSFVVVVTKSTVPVGTGALIEERIEAEASFPFAVISNPEFLREGQAVEDFLYPERVVIGSDNDRATARMCDIYAPILDKPDQLIVMDRPSAELTKYAANAFLATKISFVNEIAQLCEKVGADVSLVAQGIGSDSRIGSSFLKAGIGYGGSCFPKDVSALYKTGFQHNYHLTILDAVMKINREQKEIFVQKILDHYGGSVDGLTFGVWGLAFKPETDDVREAPAHTIVRELLGRGAAVQVYDPEAMENFRRYSGLQVTFCEDGYAAVDGVDGVLLLTEWRVFGEVDFVRVHDTMKQAVVFDGRNFFDGDVLRDRGFVYYGVGKMV